MDTTKKYSIMCKNATKIQNNWILTDGDYIFYQDNLVRIWLSSDDSTYPSMTADVIWLPQQDQLQKMVIPKFNDGAEMHLLNEFNKFVNPKMYMKYKSNYDKTPNLIFRSMEQLWLAYVMHKQYGKYWNGSKWEIKTND